MSHFPEPPNDLFKDTWFIVSVVLTVNLLHADASELAQSQLECGQDDCK